MDTEEDEVTPIAAIVDTIIGYLEKSTVYLRAVANQVFNLVTGLVDGTTVELILAVSVCFRFWLILGWGLSGL